MILEAKPHVNHSKMKLLGKKNVELKGKQVGFVLLPHLWVETDEKLLHTYIISELSFIPH